MTSIAQWVLCTQTTLANEIRLSAHHVELSEFLLFVTHILLQNLNIVSILVDSNQIKRLVA